MHRSRRRKLQGIVFVFTCVGFACALVLYALRQNISLFYTPTQIFAGNAPLHHRIRIGGMVVKHSVQRAQAGLQVHFQVTDFQHTLDVIYTGILPDLFREGQGIVAQGTLLNRTYFKATQVLAKHDENYMPPEVKNTLNAPHPKVPS